MKTPYAFISCLVISFALLGCRLIPAFPATNIIQPSNTMVTQSRDVSGFTGVNLATVGKVTITQGDTESLVIEGPDNIVPLIETTVVNNILILKLKEGYSIRPLNQDMVLSFTIQAKELSDLAVSGLGSMEMGSLTAPSLRLAMSGAGELSLDQMAVENLDVSLSGLGKVTLAGTATNATMRISGAGSLEAGDLQCQTAEIDISGLGSATVWVTDQLNGNISGAGNVSYYGAPTLSTKTSGAGKFESLGSK